MVFGETSPKNLYIGLLVAIVMFALGFRLMSDAVIQNSDAATGFSTAGFNNSINQMLEIQSDINKTQADLLAASSKNVGIITYVEALLSAGWASLVSMFKTIAYSTSFFTSIAMYLHLPSEVLVLTSIIVIIVVTWAIYLIFKKSG
jgi:hypothetical protein